MDLKIGILSPFSAPQGVKAPASRVDEAPAVQHDGYAGTVLDVESAQTPAVGRGRAVMLAALATIGIAGAFAASTLHAQPLHTAQTVSVQLQAVKYSEPGKPLPENPEVNVETWLQTSSEAAEAYKAGDAAKFAQYLSQDGVWVRGLPDAPQTETGYVHMTSEEIQRDLKDKGDFYRHVFEKHDNARFTVSPDGQARIQTILLD